MLISIIAWIYITFLCWSWGILFWKLTRSITRSDVSTPHFSIVCLSGLSLITIVAGILSLFIPLGEWWVQFIFIIPALTIFFIKSDQYFFSSLKRQFYLLHGISLALLISLLLLILVMGSWKIVHPDTLGYHAQTMQWIEKYKAVPGLVHLHVRFGYQGLWFVDCALFDFGFTGTQGITFLNSTVLFWFLLFIVNRIDHNFFKEGKKLFGVSWILLLVLSMWSYTQVRLTATSASPDFIATIFVLSIIYILIERETKKFSANEWLLAAVLSIVAVIIKLSTAPILIIAIVATVNFLVKKKYKLFLTCVIIGVFGFTAFVARNIITSGYIVFPNTAIDIANVDWKYSTELTAREKNYITAYAKKYGVVTTKEINEVNDQNITEWLPGWWNNRSAADKTIISLFLLSLIVSILSFKRIIDAGAVSILIVLTMLGGIIFWFMNAPDPRFGFGFILGTIALTSYFVFRDQEIQFGKNLTNILLICCIVSAIAYTGYRFKNFFSKGQLISPMGIPVNDYKTFDCDGVKINSPVNGEFGKTPVPCTDLDCEKFSPRGKEISDGFRAR